MAARSLEASVDNAVLLPCWNIELDKSSPNSSSYSSGDHLAEDTVRTYLSTPASPPCNDKNDKGDKNDDDDDDDDQTENINHPSDDGCGAPDDNYNDDSSSPPLLLRPNDVICGRDAAAQRHHGNCLYRQWIRAYRPYYHRAKKRIEKRQIIQDIVERIHENGGRFMVQQDDVDAATTTTNGGGVVWKIQEESKVYDKVSHSLRSSHLSPCCGSASRTSDGDGGPAAATTTKPRPRRTRRYCVIPPTEAENHLFEAVFTHQQAIFHALVADRASSSSSSRPTYLSELPAAAAAAAATESCRRSSTAPCRGCSDHYNFHHH